MAGGFSREWSLYNLCWVSFLAGILAASASFILLSSSLLFAGLNRFSRGVGDWWEFGVSSRLLFTTCLDPKTVLTFQWSVLHCSLLISLRVCSTVFQVPIAYIKSLTSSLFCSWFRQPNLPSCWMVMVMVMVYYWPTPALPTSEGFGAWKRFFFPLLLFT